MSWSNYLINKEQTVAIRVRNSGYDDIDLGDDFMSINFERFVIYMADEEEPIFDVLKYLWKMCDIENSHDAVMSLFSQYTKDEEWTIINDEELSKIKDVKVVGK